MEVDSPAFAMEAATVVLLWAVAVWWWFRRTEGQSWLCTALTAYAFTATVRLPPVYMGAQALMGVPLGSTLLIQVGQVVILASMWEALSASAPTGRTKTYRRWRIATALTTAFSMSALFLLGYLAYPEQWPTTDFELRFAMSPAPLAAFLWIYGLYDAAALLACIVLSLKEGFLARLWSARVGLVLTGVAYASALVLHGWTMLVYAGALQDQQLLVQYAGAVIIKGGFLLVVIGMSMPALASALARVTATLSQKRNHRSLEPFWLRLSESAPEIVLLPPRSLPDPWTQLYRRTIETWDGIQTVARWGAYDFEHQARHHCPLTWRWPRHRKEAAVTAMCIEAAIQRRAAGGDAPLESPGSWQRSEHMSFNAELKWLISVSRAWSSPAIRRAATSIAQHGDRLPSTARPESSSGPQPRHHPPRNPS